MISFKVEGFKELEQALRQLPQEIAGRTLRNGLRRAGQPLADRWRSSAPRSDRPSSAGHAADSITMSSSSDRQAASDLDVTVVVGPSRRGFYLQFDEFGTRYQSPSGVGRRAFEAQKDAILRDFGRELGAAIERAAKRLAR